LVIELFSIAITATATTIFTATLYIQSKLAASAKTVFIESLFSGFLHNGVCYFLVSVALCFWGLLAFCVFTCISL